MRSNNRRGAAAAIRYLQSRRQLGVTAAQRVLASLRGESNADLPLECVIDVELVVRDSCAPIAS